MNRPSRTAVLVVVVWLVLAATGLFAALRALGYEDDSGRFFALVTLTPLLLLPAWFALVAGALLRRWIVVALALLVVGAHVAWVAPDLRWWPLEQPDTRLDADSFTVAAANVRFSNRRTADVAAALRRLDADVLVVEELTPTVAAALRQHGYPFVEEDARDGAFGSGVYSRFPIANAVRFQLDSLPALRVDVGTPGRPITLVAVHTLQPLSDIDVLDRQLRQLDTLARSLRRDGRDVVLAGDFNATTQHRGFNRLLDHGMRDAHRERGRGRVRTWPADRWHPPFAAIDHVLVSGDIAVEDAGTAGIPGSDHRAVTAELSLS